MHASMDTSCQQQKNTHFTLPETITTTTTTKASASKTKRTVPVPSPRPGELLIYDCRPKALDQSQPIATVSIGIDCDSLSSPSTSPLAFSYSSTGVHSSFSPSTPIPDLRGGAIFEERTLAKTQHESGQSGSSTRIEGASDAAAGIEHEKQRPIRCLQWNIERNYKPAEILATLKELDADILCIQEIDIGCHRSGHERDHFLEICKSQGLYGGFVPEFWELEHPGRKDRDQGGGVHGNAILSKWPINGFRALDHVHHAYEWEKDGLKLNEPRIGR
ncbi:hypothetical protein BCR41DRAFT_202637 [Lobosporangium transversale]|uniref:Endonuclease/exonuclease/phosphatase domain-containing protein n=1 Tax=Lobosporangium transversale TaxID=64571 RepID=A0A1Y2GXR1_9FUNG|nr:hypothetical protein BCR41DRAFT_202637 [Lobosporangium transversale]ORZ26604.1 hypothetical protein BCR41DRAFT_202637 [Lobosporangium transversale]|eukprot:XP_021884367.1 hypothetical protein BCR41DRAFT_202637 [Lobosporangium transversale]